MCARFTLRQTTALAERFQARLPVDLDPTPRVNIAPSQAIPIVIADQAAAERRLLPARWGLIPAWAKDASIGTKLINARAETLAEKPSFRSALQRRRCLIPADGFYEWAALPPTGGRARKQPIFIHRREDDLFAIAGLYEEWRNPAGEVVTSCTLITTRPNALMEPIHDRMPAILRPVDEAAWLAPALPTDWSALLAPYPADWLAAYPVSPAINRPGQEDPSLLQPVAVPLATWSAG